MKSHRPEFPNPYCPLTPNIISRIISNQEFYDKDPEGYERRERAREEERRQEQEREQEG
jgi:hypothetical protein